MGRAQERTRHQIITAFLDLLAEQYFDTISVSKVSDASFVTRSTFYRYFKDKNDLLFNAIESTISQSVPDQALMSQFVNYVEAYWPLLRHLSPSRQSRSNLNDILNQILWDMVHRRVKETPNDTDPMIQLMVTAEHPELMISVVEGMMMGVMEYYVQNDVEKIDKRELEDTMSDIVGKLTR